MSHMFVGFSKFQFGLAAKAGLILMVLMLLISSIFNTYDYFSSMYLFDIFMAGIMSFFIGFLAFSFLHILILSYARKKYYDERKDIIKRQTGQYLDAKTVMNIQTQANIRYQYSKVEYVLACLILITMPVIAFAEILSYKNFGYALMTSLGRIIEMSVVFIICSQISQWLSKLTAKWIDDSLYEALYETGLVFSVFVYLGIFTRWAVLIIQRHSFDYSLATLILLTAMLSLAAGLYTIFKKTDLSVENYAIKFAHDEELEENPEVTNADGIMA